MSSLFEYRRELDVLQFTQEQKAQLAEAAALATDGPARRSRPMVKIAVIAACLAAVLAVGAGAAGVLPVPADVFAPIFGGSVAQTEIIDRIGHPIGASDTDGGVTISADAIMGDEYNAVIIYTISRDDGERFLPEGRTLENSTLMLGGFGGSSWIKNGGSYGSAWFVDEDPEDNRVQYVETVTSDVSLTQGTATAEFRDIRWADGEDVSDGLLYGGKWKFRFDVSFEDCSVRMGGGETFQQNGMTFTINEVRVSPLAVKVDYTVDKELKWNDGIWEADESGVAVPYDREADSYLQNVEILLTRTDGTVIDLSDAGGGIHPDNGVSVCTKGQVLDEIIPLEELESISVGGVAYPITAE